MTGIPPRLALLLVWALAVPERTVGQAPASNLRLAAPIASWDEALPLGNGLLGGLVWGGGDTLNISLDRGDLWDLRLPETLQRPDWTFATVRALVAAGDHRRRVELFDDPYDKIPYPTKLPAGRLVVTFDSSYVAERFLLSLATAEATVSYRARRATGFFSATEPVAMTIESASMNVLSPCGPVISIPRSVMFSFFTPRKVLIPRCSSLSARMGR